MRSKNYSSNASNKIRYSNEWGTVELESWVSFPSQDEEVKSQLWEYSLNSIKQELKEQLLDPFNKLKKREAKQFDKLSFQQQILSEFRKFTDGVLEKMDNQNKMLSELVTTIKNGHTSSPIYHNHNNNKFLQFNKSQNQQSDVEEHQIENPEMFRELYPFERFEQDQFQNLESESKKFYQRLIKFTSNWKPLAYYFFENRGLSINVRKGIINIYNQYSSKYSSFTVDNIRNFITNLDITNSMTSSSLHLHYERLKRVAEIAYELIELAFQN